MPTTPVVFDQNSAARIDAVVRAVEGEAIDLTGGPGQTVVRAGRRYFLAIVQANGPSGAADLTGNKYWVKRARIKNKSSTADDVTISKELVEVEAEPFYVEGTTTPNPNYLHIGATNLSETGHGLSVGSVVRVFIDYDQEKGVGPKQFSKAFSSAFSGNESPAPPHPRYDFTQGGGSPLTRMTVTSQAAYPDTTSIVLCRPPGDTTSPEVPVRAVQGHAVGDDIFVMTVSNGTGRMYGSPQAQVALIEYFVPANISTTPHTVMKVIDSTGRIGVGPVATH